MCSPRTWTALETVCGALYAKAATVEDEGVNHRGTGFAMAEQFLNGRDVVAVFEQVGCKRATERRSRLRGRTCDACSEALADDPSGQRRPPRYQRRKNAS
jgi:hypothetical protein